MCIITHILQIRKIEVQREYMTYWRLKWKNSGRVRIKIHIGNLLKNTVIFYYKQKTLIIPSMICTY